MAIEDHPMFHEWKRRLEAVIETKEAVKVGNATQADLEKALTEYHTIADEI